MRRHYRPALLSPFGRAVLAATGFALAAGFACLTIIEQMPLP